MVLSRRWRRGALVVVVAGLGLGGCGDDDGATSPATTTTTAVAGTSTTVAVTTPATTTTTPSGRTADFTYAGGSVSGPNRVTVRLGEQVTIRVTSDVAEEIHVHTYDRTADLVPNVPGEVSFTADIPGVHEVELEHSARHLTSLEVQ